MIESAILLGCGLLFGFLAGLRASRRALKQAAENELRCSALESELDSASTRIEKQVFEIRDLKRDRDRFQLSNARALTLLSNANEQK